jgi:hypothetical protein
LPVAREVAEFDDDEAMEMDLVMMHDLASKMHLHHLPIVVLGSGRTTLRDKFCAIMHSFFLEAGSTFDSLASFCSDIITCTTDFGVEFGLASVQPHDITAILPFYPRELLLFTP